MEEKRLWEFAVDCCLTATTNVYVEADDPDEAADLVQALIEQGGLRERLTEMAATAHRTDDVLVEVEAVDCGEATRSRAAVEKRHEGVAFTDGSRIWVDPDLGGLG